MKELSDFVRNVFGLKVPISLVLTPKDWKSSIGPSELRDESNFNDPLSFEKNVQKPVGSHFVFVECVE